jgi:hypothetical protein
LLLTFLRFLSFRVLTLRNECGFEARPTAVSGRDCCVDDAGQHHQVARQGQGQHVHLLRIRGILPCLYLLFVFLLVFFFLVFFFVNFQLKFFFIFFSFFLELVLDFVLLIVRL